MATGHHRFYRQVRVCGLKALELFSGMRLSVRGISFHWGHRPSSATGPTVVFCPASATVLHCGLSGLITVYGRRPPAPIEDLKELTALTDQILAAPLHAFKEEQVAIETGYLDGDDSLQRFLQLIQALKRQDHFLTLYGNQPLQEELIAIHRRLERFRK